MSLLPLDLISTVSTFHDTDLNFKDIWGYIILWLYNTTIVVLYNENLELSPRGLWVNIQ